jgi:hypothetical protein
MDVRLLDVVGAEHGLPMAPGMSLRRQLPVDPDYDEVEYDRGELHHHRRADRRRPSR